MFNLGLYFQNLGLTRIMIFLDLCLKGFVIRTRVCVSGYNAQLWDLMSYKENHIVKCKYLVFGLCFEKYF